MTKATRYVMVSALMVTGLAGAARVTEAAGETTPPGRLQVRSSNLAIRALIVQATEQSATFRRMVETINASDGVVYVEEGTCPRGERACFVSVTGDGAHRLLWVKIDLRRVDGKLIASIGHELRHTIEVLDAPSVTSNAKLFMFYALEGFIGTSGAFETVAAVEAGQAVSAEVKAFLRTSFQFPQ